MTGRRERVHSIYERLTARERACMVRDAVNEGNKLDPLLTRTMPDD